MDIKGLIKEHHQMMIDRGFHDIESRGISKRNHVIELIALIGGELLGEALEAHRCENFADWDVYENDYEIELEDYIQPVSDKIKLELQNKNFESYVKDYFEDEMADTLLRLLDLSGYLGIKSLSLYETTREIAETVPEEILNLSTYCVSMHQTIKSNLIDETGQLKKSIERMFVDVHRFCLKLNIDIDKHISFKMAYNRTRPHKHGKNY